MTKTAQQVYFQEKSGLNHFATSAFVDAIGMVYGDVRSPSLGIPWETFYDRFRDAQSSILNATKQLGPEYTAVTAELEQDFREVEHYYQEHFKTPTDRLLTLHALLRIRSNLAQLRQEKQAIDDILGEFDYISP